MEDFLAGSRGAVVLENGAVVFDLAQAKYSISGEYNKCLLHLWSAERNVVRRVLDAEVKNEVLRLAVQRLGQARPTKLEICRERDRRTPSDGQTRGAAGLSARPCGGCWNAFPAYHIAQAQHGDGPGAVVRAHLHARTAAPGAVGVRGAGSEWQETQASIDAALTFGILWLDVCRQSRRENWWWRD